MTVMLEVPFWFSTCSSCFNFVAAVLLYSLKRSPTQVIEGLESAKNGWENIILNINNSNAYFTIFLGDFNARNTIWWCYN